MLKGEECWHVSYLYPNMVRLFFWLIILLPKILKSVQNCMNCRENIENNLWWPIPTEHGTTNMSIAQNVCCFVKKHLRTIWEIHLESVSFCFKSKCFHSTLMQSKLSHFTLCSLAMTSHSYLAFVLIQSLELDHETSVKIRI